MYSITDFVQPLMSGAVITLKVMILSVIVALVLSFVFGFMKLSKWKILRWIANVYIEVFRGTSLLIQLFWLFFALPLLGVELSALTAGVLAIGLNYGAYGAEVVRGAIQTISKGQTEAAIALNMTPFQRMRIVILPQAFALMVPTFGNLSIELLKGTSLVSLITLSDMTFQAANLRNATMQTTEIYTLLLIMYFFIAYPITLGFRKLEKKLTVGRA